MLRTFSIFVVAIVVAVAFARTLTFGHDKPDRPAAALVPARAPAVTPPPPGAVVITITPDGVTVSPASARAQHGLLAVRVVNHGLQMSEVLLHRPGVRRLVPLGTGEQRDDELRLPAGRYTVTARPLTEGDARPAHATGTARLRVLR